MKYLSKVARQILVLTTLRSLPIYAMQTVCIPKGVLNHLKKLSRSLFWRDEPRMRLQHMVAWDRICQSKACGGMSLPKLKMMNMVVLAKLLWRLIKFLNKASCEILRAKYGG